MSESIEHDICSWSLDRLLAKYPFASEYFKAQGLEFIPASIERISDPAGKSLPELLGSLSETLEEDTGLDTETLCRGLAEYIKGMLAFLEDRQDTVIKVSLFAGTNKSGNQEGFEQLDFHRGEIISIVGPTGSGKSRLLADIEWMAQEDTPTGRRVLINGEVPDKKHRFSSSDKLVAQLSQNMNFVMDVSVREFLELHAECRMTADTNESVKRILEEANRLAGESFDPETPVTSLSGGQSRALMIADTAILSTSPIVLIDEIENAGIDRKQALKLLIGEEKIVLMATHDPVLALMGDRRIIIKNGGISKVVETSPGERELLAGLEKADLKIQEMRRKLRAGETLCTTDALEVLAMGSR